MTNPSEAKDHDPLCPRHRLPPHADDCDACEVIARVRADERARVIQDLAEADREHC